MQRTHLENVLVCGADQGYVGIVGTLTSGIQVANQLLRPFSHVAHDGRHQLLLMSIPPWATGLNTMPRDFLQGVADEYDCIVIGSGLAGLTCANTLARAGHRVLLLEQHYKLGGMATWFRRPAGTFSISRCTAFRSA